MASHSFEKVILIHILLIQSIFCYTVLQKLCPRIIFSTSNNFPYKSVVESVFIKDTGNMENGFPVYGNERANIYIVFRNGFFYFVPSLQWRGEHLLRIALTASNTRMNRARKTSLDMLNLNKVQYKTPGNEWSEEYDLKLSCVDFSECQTKRLRLSLPLKELFFKQENYFHEYRPVYRFEYSQNKTGLNEISETKPYKLYYAHGYWMIGGNFPTLNGYMTVKSNAMKPEYILDEWDIFSLGAWTPINASLYCAREGQVNCSFCQNGGKCRTNLNRETYCVCPMGFQGKYCDLKSSTCEMRNFPNLNNEDGHVSTRSCQTPGKNFEISICHQNRWNIMKKCANQSIPKIRAAKSRGAGYRYRYRSSSTYTTYNSGYYAIYALLPIWILVYPYSLQIRFHTSCCGIKSGAKIYSIHYHFGLYAWILYLGLYYKYELGISKLARDMAIYAYVFGAFMYIYILIEGWYCKERRLLENSKDVMVGKTKIKNYIDSMKANEPKITIHGEAYHFETRTKMEKYKDENGHSQTRETEYEEKLVTWTGSEVFVYKSWIDVTDETNHTLLGSVKHMKFKRTYVLADAETRQAFTKLANEFTEKHKDHDKLLDTHWEYDIDGFRETILYKDEEVAPILNNFVFWTLCISLLAWPYRYWLIKNSKDNFALTIHKCISINKHVTSEAATQSSNTVYSDHESIPSVEFSASTANGESTVQITNSEKSQPFPSNGIPGAAENPGYFPDNPVYISNILPYPNMENQQNPSSPQVAPPSYDDVLNSSQTATT